MRFRNVNRNLEPHSALMSLSEEGIWKHSASPDFSMGQWLVLRFKSSKIRFLGISLAREQLKGYQVSEIRPMQSH